MNGHFEVGNSSYPIGYLESGDGYKVTDMRTLEPLHSSPISRENAAKISSQVNQEYRTSAYGTLSSLQRDVARRVAEII